MTSRKTFTLSSPAFAAGAEVPARFTCDGDDISPHLVWSGAPTGTASFALIVDDPDAPRGTFTHWVVFDIPADCAALPSGARSGAIGVWGCNSRGQVDYMGPCPPSGTHRYVFRLLALDVATLALTAGASRREVERAAARHTIATAELMARYHRSAGDSTVRRS